MSNTPNFELLKDAYAIIGGIPNEVIDLCDVQLHAGDSLGCGTVCCAAGWLGHHPQFQALGLETTRAGSTKLDGKFRSYDDAMAEVFNMDPEDAEKMFAPRNFLYERNERANGGTDKALWLTRVREYLRRHGQLKSQLAKAAAA